MRRAPVSRCRVVFGRPSKEKARTSMASKTYGAQSSVARKSLCQPCRRKYFSGVGTGTMRIGVITPAAFKASAVKGPPTNTNAQRLAVSTQLFCGLPSNWMLGMSGNSQAGTTTFRATGDRKAS